MQTPIFSSATLAEFFRFALLLTGRGAAAEQVIAETLAEGEAQLGQLRTETNRQAWLVAHIRRRCLQKNDESPAPTVPRLLREPPGPDGRVEVLAIEAYILAEHFRCLPEPQRSALALFYLELFSPEEIAQLLKMKLEELGAVLAQAREQLQRSLTGSARPI